MITRTRDVSSCHLWLYRTAVRILRILKFSNIHKYLRILKPPMNIVFRSMHSQRHLKWLYKI